MKVDRIWQVPASKTGKRPKTPVANTVYSPRAVMLTPSGVLALREVPDSNDLVGASSSSSLELWDNLLAPNRHYVHRIYLSSPQ